MKQEYPGKVIVIEGIDGSGKTTQTERLMVSLAEQGLNVKTQDFPRHGHPAFYCGDRYLTGAYGNDVKALGSWGPSMFYAIDRFDFAFTEMWPALRQGVVWVLNRYVQSNYGHQGGKIEDRVAREAFFREVDTIEFERFGIPRWDFTVFLSVPPVLSRQFVLRKKAAERRAGERDYLGGEVQDLHEQDLLHLINAARAYDHAGEFYGERWSVVDCLVPVFRDEVAALSQRVLEEHISAQGVTKLLRRPLEDYLLDPDAVHSKVAPFVLTFLGLK